MTSAPFDFSQFSYAPVLPFPEAHEVYDFSNGYDPERVLKTPYGVGRYNERRPGMYKTSLFTADPSSARDIHIGIDLSAPIGTAVHAFYDGRIYMTAINATPGDYGGTVITEHTLGDRTIWALYGHLSHASVKLFEAGASIHAGTVIGYLGSKEENGGWNPHVHFQLSWTRPERCDLPGAVNERDLAASLEMYPDPRLVLGALY